jgi:regulatory protein
MNKVNFEIALHRLAAYCSRAERCVYDIRQKMLRWELSDSDQKKILQRLQAEKFLDEQRFCKAFVNDKSKYSHWGAYKIKYALKNKQIPPELIDEAMQHIDPLENREQLRELLKKKRKTVKGANEYEIRIKLMRFAAGRGFSPDDINAALR